VTAFLIALMVLGDAASDVLITRGMKQVGEVASLRPLALFRTAGRVARNPSFVLGLAVSSLHFAAFVCLLSYADLSFVIPASALVYVVSTLGARLFLDERVTPRRWAGSALVCAGVALLSIGR